MCFWSVTIKVCVSAYPLEYVIQGNPNLFLGYGQSYLAQSKFSLIPSEVRIVLPLIKAN